MDVAEEQVVIDGTITLRIAESITIYESRMQEDSITIYDFGFLLFNFEDKGAS